VNRRPVKAVRIWSIQDPFGNPRVKSPFIVRWVVDGKAHSLSFRVEAVA
jgi:hypothetical protein